MIFKKTRADKKKIKKIERDMKILHSVDDFNRAIYLIDDVIKVTEENLGCRKKKMPEMQDNLRYLQDFKSFLNMYKLQIYGNFGHRNVLVNNKFRIVPSRFPKLFILIEKIKQFFRKLIL